MAVVVLQADARAIPLPDRSVQCVITSPPYWGLRDYGQVGQIGLEKTPEDYVAAIVEVFAEVWRVLRDDGTCWLNLGDSYAANRSYQVPSTKGGPKHSPAQAGQSSNRVPDGLKSKDLIGIPWRVAFALQAAGWYLRSDIIWAKPNPMPESVTDRPTRSHEYVFLLTKRERYFYDAEAIKEACISTKPAGNKTRLNNGRVGSGGGFNVRSNPAASIPTSGRNRRSVWSITTKPYAGAHFATFPVDLVEPCLLAGTPEQSCADCGAPYTRIIERGEPRRDQQLACGSNGDGEYHGQATKDFTAAGAQDASATKARILAGMVEKRTIGWRATCGCAPAYTAPAIVLDPFGGSGTVGVVASAHGRDAFVIDRKFDYCQLAVDRQHGRTPTRERDKQAGHGRRHAGFNERYFGTGDQP